MYSIIYGITAFLDIVVLYLLVDFSLQLIDVEEGHVQDMQLIEELTTQLNHKSQQYAQLNCKFKQAEQKLADLQVYRTTSERLEAEMMAMKDTIEMLKVTHEEELQKAEIKFEDERKAVKERSNLLEIQSQEIKVLNNKLGDAESLMRESKEDMLQVKQREQEAKDKASSEVSTSNNHPEKGQKSLL